MIEIEKDVPVPQYAGYKNRKYPFQEMEVGDSILVEEKARQALSHWIMRSQTEKKFVTRKEGDKVRIWRFE
ncbi:hypothetical protein LCGC14_2235170 [marine sediment metagenome]|uniref:Uncharacterized protein n=1 Tax=marine sediment metagenome TaxID=412755 RepID=A0A0F9D7B1_9ZZZZ